MIESEFGKEWLCCDFCKNVQRRLLPHEHIESEFHICDDCQSKLEYLIDNFGQIERLLERLMPKDSRGGAVEEIEARKKSALEEIAEMDKEIERIRAEEEQKRNIDLIGLYRRMESLIKTSSSSMSDDSIGEIREIDFNSDEGVAEPYMRTIDVEISGRYRDDHDTVTRFGIDQLARPLHTDDPTLVVSFLIPFNLVEDDPFFK